MMRRLLMLALVLAAIGPWSGARSAGLGADATQWMYARFVNAGVDIYLNGQVGGGADVTGVPPNASTSSVSQGCVSIYKDDAYQDSGCGPLVIVVDPSLTFASVTGQLVSGDETITVAVTFAGTGTPSSGTSSQPLPNASMGGWVNRPATAVGSIASTRGAKIEGVPTADASLYESVGVWLSAP